MPRPLRWYDLLTINIYFTGLTTLAQTMTPLVVPLLVQQFVGEARQGSFYGTARLWSLMTALLVQALMGMLSDHSHHRFGRRRPFILLGTLGDLLVIVAIGFTAGLQGMTGFLGSIYSAGSAPGYFQHRAGCSPGSDSRPGAGRTAGSLFGHQIHPGSAHTADPGFFHHRQAGGSWIFVGSTGSLHGHPFIYHAGSHVFSGAGSFKICTVFGLETIPSAAGDVGSFYSHHPGNGTSHPVLQFLTGRHSSQHLPGGDGCIGLPADVRDGRSRGVDQRTHQPGSGGRQKSILFLVGH